MSKTRLRPTRGSVVMLTLAAAFFVASRTAGAGWLSVMVALLLGIIIWSTIEAWWSVGKVSIDISGPSDAVAGRRFELDVAASAPRSGALISVGTGRHQVWIDEIMSGRFPITSIRRGVIGAFPIEIRSSGSLGLVTAIRSTFAPLPRAIDVAPVATPVALPASATMFGKGETSVGGRHTDGETVRSVREYQPGDPLRMINWAVTARRDQLAVKELEAPQSPTLIVSLDLRGDPEVAEKHASLAAGYVQNGLRSGLPVILQTHEKSGPHAGGVGSMLEAGRRLARAIPGPLPAHQDGVWSTVIHLGQRV